MATRITSHAEFGLLSRMEARVASHTQQKALAFVVCDILNHLPHISDFVYI